MFLIKLVFLLLSLSFSEANEFKLSDSKLLLPFSAHTQVQYTLSGSDSSCYEWISSAQDVVTVTPIASVNGCSNKAVVSSVWQSDHRATATIYAKHSVTGHTVKCDIIVDRIHRIEIETTTQELYLHNTPEALTVFGFDEHGNLFSTLDGIPFEWHIHGTDSLASTRSVLRFISWTESEYATPPKIGQLESEGMQGHVQLVSGLRTGSDLVSARIKEPFYNDITKAEVRLLVMANVQLHPPIAYLFPSATLRYRISTIQATSQLDIKLPSSQYYLEINDTALAIFTEPSGPEIVALMYGQTSITLIDRNVEEAINVDRSDGQSEQVKWSPSRPVSLVYVVEPAYLAFSLISFEASAKIWPNCHFAMNNQKESTGQKLRQWIMEAGRTYAIAVELYDHNSHRIHSSDNLRVSVDFPPHFNVISSTENGTFHLITPTEQGPTQLHATLLGTIQKGMLVNYEQSISGEQSIQVYERVLILPPVMVYPLLTTQSYNLTAILGSGEYTWRLAGLEPSLEANVGIVSQRGEFTPAKLGENYAIAYDARSPRICNHGRLIVAKPSRLGFAAGRTELFVIQPDKVKEQLSRRSPQLDYSDCNGIPAGIDVQAQHVSTYGILTVGLMVYDAQGNAFTDCRGLHISLTSQDPSKVIVLDEVLLPSNHSHMAQMPDHPALPCLRFRVYGVSPGYTSLFAEFHSPEADNVASVSYPVAVYSALKLLNPQSGKSHVAVGSTKSFKWLLGPQPWFLEPSSYSASVKVQSDHLTVVSKPAHLSKASVDSSPMSFSVRCEEKGVFSLQLRLGNMPTPKNIKPLSLVRHMDIICDWPHTTRLFYKVPQLTLPAGVPACPINTTTSDVFKHIPNTLTTKMEIGYFMENGQELDAFDSIETSVKILDERGYAASSIVYPTEPQVTAPENQEGRRYFEIVPRELGVSIGALTAAVTSTMKRSVPSVDTRTNLLMISAVSIEPKESVRLFHHPNATASVQISHGSGFVHLSISPSNEYRASSAITIKPEFVTSNTLLPVAVSLSQTEPYQPQKLILHSLRQGTAFIHVIDRCFLSAALNLPVQVVGLASLHLTLTDHVQLQHKVTAHVEALDTEGQPLPAPYASLLDLSLHAIPLSSAGVANTTLLPSGEDTSREIIQLPSAAIWEGARASFSVLGTQLGVAQVLVQSQSLRSNTVRIHVFAPPSLAPCDMNLLNGAHLELRVHGGPSHAPVEYRVQQNSHLLRLIQSSGTRSVLLHAQERKTGTALVEAWTGELVARCSVHIVAISGLRVRSALGGTRALYAGQKIPLWAEGVALGGDGSGRITPLGLAGAGIQFAWTVQPTEAASIFFWLEQFGTKPRPESMTAGMLLHAKRPGPVVVHLTATTVSGQTFQASLEVMVVPALTFSAPYRPNPQQVLVTPGSHFQIYPNSPITETSMVQAKLLHTDCANPGDSKQAAIELDSSGLLKVHHFVRRASSASASSESLCSALVQVSTRAKHQGHALHEEAFLHVQVKHARYALATPLAPSAQPSAFVEGLRSGGPYKLHVSFHDEFGAPLDAVSNHLSSIVLQSHRSDIAVAQIALPAKASYSKATSQGIFSSSGIAGDLILRVLSPSAKLEPDLSNSALILKFGLVDDPQEEKNEASNSGYFSSIYLLIPRAPGLNLAALGPFQVGQWSCFPEQTKSGTWEADNDNIWLHSSSGLFVARKPGTTFVSFVPLSESAHEASLMGKIRVDPIQPLFKLISSSSSDDHKPVKIPFVPAPDTSVSFTLFPDIRSDLKSRSCEGGHEDKLEEQSPFTCQVVQRGGEEGERFLTPDWLRKLLIWDDEKVEQWIDLARGLFLTRMHVSKSHFGHWLCSVQLNQSLWSKPNAQSQLSLAASEADQRKYQVQVQMHESDDFSPILVASRDLELIPPLLVADNVLHFGASNQETGFDWSRGQLLVHVPHATQQLMLVNKDRVQVRSTAPKSIIVTSEPRQVEEKQFVAYLEKRLAAAALKSTRDRLHDILQNFRDLKVTKPEETTFWLKQLFLCDLELGQNGIEPQDWKPELSVSLATTRQHINIPVTVDAKTFAGVTQRNVNEMRDATSWLWTRMIPAAILILLTFLIFRSMYASGMSATRLDPGIKMLGGDGGSFARTMPKPRISLGVEHYDGSAPKLWSRTSPNRFSPPENTFYRGRSSNLSPNNSDYRVRHSSGCSPSRLRSVFDQSM